MTKTINEDFKEMQEVVNQMAIDILHCEVCTAVSFGRESRPPSQPEDSITFYDNVSVSEENELIVRKLLGKQLVLFMLRNSFKLFGGVCVDDYEAIRPSVEFALQQPTVTIAIERTYLLTDGRGSPGKELGMERSSVTLNTNLIKCYVLPIEALKASWIEAMENLPGVVYGPQDVVDGTVGVPVPSKKELH